LKIGVFLFQEKEGRVPEGIKVERFDGRSWREANEHSILVLAITSAGMREFVFYTRDATWVKSVLEVLQTTLTWHEIQSYVAKDPEWEVDKTFPHNKLPPLTSVTRKNACVC
jgi:hypothetical protein